MRWHHSLSINWYKFKWIPDRYVCKAEIHALWNYCQYNIFKCQVLHTARASKDSSEWAKYETEIRSHHKNIPNRIRSDQYFAQLDQVWKLKTNFTMHSNIIIFFVWFQIFGQIWCHFVRQRIRNRWNYFDFVAVVLANCTNHVWRSVSQAQRLAQIDKEVCTLQLKSVDVFALVQCWSVCVQSGSHLPLFKANSTIFEQLLLPEFLATNSCTTRQSGGFVWSDPSWTWQFHVQGTDLFNGSHFANKSQIQYHFASGYATTYFGRSTWVSLKIFRKTLKWII